MTLTSTFPSDLRWARSVTEHNLGEGTRVQVADRDRSQPFLLLHGGAGPTSVAGFGDLLAARTRSRVFTPTHPGFDGTARPDHLDSIAALAHTYVELLERLDVWDVTVVGNSIGGWIATELALLGCPRLSGIVLIDSVGFTVPGHAVSDVSDLEPGELDALVYFEPDRFAAGDPGDTASEVIAANARTLAAYCGGAMSDPTLLERSRDLELPVHLIWGAADGIVGPDYGRAVAAAIPYSHFTLLETAAHLPQVEAPEDLLAAIRHIDL
ncbi:MAG: alpha/beta hydrolase [Terracoccus sp.]